MNYIQEIKAFYDRLELNPQPNQAIALWHALMSIANKAGWPDTFTVASSVLGLRSGLSASGIKRARNQLTQDKFIEWKPRGGNLSAVYKINTLAVQYEPQVVPQTVPQGEPQSVPQTEPQSGPINKLKLKQEQKKDTNVSKESRFNNFFAAYPKQNNILAAEKGYMLVLFDNPNLSEDDLLQSARNYAEAVKLQNTDSKFIKDANNFLKDGKYLDYLPENYKKPAAKKEKNKFSNFEQNNYDLDALEKELLNN